MLWKQKVYALPDKLSSISNMITKLDVDSNKIWDIAEEIMKISDELLNYVFEKDREMDRMQVEIDTLKKEIRRLQSSSPDSNSSTKSRLFSWW